MEKNVFLKIFPNTQNYCININNFVTSGGYYCFLLKENVFFFQIFKFTNFQKLEFPLEKEM